MRFVLVTGPPGAGKSTLAGPLAARLGLPLIAKDDIKEALGDVLGDPPGEWEADWSTRLSAASFTVLFAVAARCPRAVLEGNFSGPSIPALRALDDRPLEVFCRCPLDLCRQRFAGRLAGGRRHPVHPPVLPPPDFFAGFDAPLAVGPVIEVATDRPVDLDRIARWVTDQAAGASGRGSGDGAAGWR
jgi:hypothetical protein